MLSTSVPYLICISESIAERTTTAMYRLQPQLPAECKEENLEKDGQCHRRSMVSATIEDRACVNCYNGENDMCVRELKNVEITDKK